MTLAILLLLAGLSQAATNLAGGQACAGKVVGWDGSSWVCSDTTISDSGTLVGVVSTSVLPSSVAFVTTPATFTARQTFQYVSVGVSPSSTSLFFTGGASGDNYIAYPFIAGGAITAKQVMVLTSTRTVNAVARANDLNVIGISVNSTAGAGETVWVAVSGIVTNVPNSAAAVSVGQRVASSATSGSVFATTTAAASIGVALTPAANSTSLTVLLDRR